MAFPQECSPLLAGAGGGDPWKPACLLALMEGGPSRRRVVGRGLSMGHVYLKAISFKPCKNCLLLPSVCVCICRADIFCPGTDWCGQRETGGCSVPAGQLLPPSPGEPGQEPLPSW